MKKITALILAALMVLSFAGCGKTTETASSGDLLSQIKERGYITIATEGDWSPWTYHDEDDNLTGFDVELGKLIADKLGVEAQFKETDWDSILAGVETGVFDIACNGVGYTEERAKSYNMSEPYVYSNTVLVVRDDEEDITCFEDLDGKTTANTASSTYAQVAESYGAAVTPVNTLLETIELLTQGRIDATLNAKDSIADYLKSHPDAPIKIVDETAGNDVVIPATRSTDSDTLVAAINTALEEIRADGTLKELSEKYFGEDLTEKAE